MEQQPEWTRKAEIAVSTSTTPHYAPTAAMLALFGQRMHDFISRQSSSGVALILGATPELADLTFAAGLPTTRVDCNPQMFAATAPRQRIPDLKNDSRVVADWRGLPVSTGGVSIVLGDAALNNVAHNDMRSMLGELHRVCRSPARIILRQIIRIDGAPASYRFEAIITAFRNGTISADEMDRVLRFHAFNAEAFNQALHQIDATKVFKLIRQRYVAKQINDTEFDFLMSRYSAVKHTVYTLAEQTRLFESVGRVTIDFLPAGCFYRDLMAVFSIDV